MLTLLVASMLAQGTVCEFPERRWTVLGPQQLRLEDGTVFAKFEREGCRVGAPWASGVVDALGIGHLRVQSKGFTVDVDSQVELFAAAPIAFSGGFTSGDATGLRIVGSRGGRMTVIPASREDLERKRDWTPREVKCDDLRLSPVREVEPLSSEVSIRAGTPLLSAPSGSVAFVAKDRLPVQRLSDDGPTTEVRVLLADGARVHAWVNRASIGTGSGSGVAVGSAICCGALKPAPDVCAHSLPLFLQNAERVVKVGEIDKGTQLDVAYGNDYAEVTPREGTAYQLEPGWHWAVPNEDLYACGVEKTH